jgi:hypothetical protein
VITANCVAAARVIPLPRVHHELCTSTDLGADVGTPKETADGIEIKDAVDNTGDEGVSEERAVSCACERKAAALTKVVCDDDSGNSGCDWDEKAETL